MAKRATIVDAARRGNEPLAFRPAYVDDVRNVRLKLDGTDIGLATTAYSYHLTNDEQADATRRLTALWNMAAISGWSTEQIEAMVEVIRERKS